MKKKSILFILIAVFTAIMAACSDNLPDYYPERGSLAVEVGEEFVLPAWITENASDFSIKNPDGQSEVITGGSVYLSKIGKYTIQYKRGKSNLTAVVEAVDTKGPMFEPLWEEYRFTEHLPVYVFIGLSTRLDEIFRPQDNSGEPITLTFRLWHGGAFLIELGEGGLFTPEAGWYEAEARAIDSSGNATLIRQKLTAIAG